MMAVAAFSPASFPESSSGTNISIPFSTTSITSCAPITPVEATSTCSGAILRSSPAFSASFLQLEMPSSPVQALAMPLFTTTACAFPSLYTTSLSQKTGAAFTTFFVNVPAHAASFSE